MIKDTPAAGAIFPLAELFGGRDAFIDAVNDTLTRCRAPESPMTQRIYYLWNERGVAAGMRQWVAIACVRKKLDIAEARRICPDIDTAIRAAELLVFEDEDAA